MNEFQRTERAEVYRSFRAESVAPSAGDLSRRVGAPAEAQTVSALRALADEHCRGNGRCSWRCEWGTRRERAGVQDGAGASG